MTDKMEKPKKPIEPNIRDYPIPTEPNGKNHLGTPLHTKLDWIRDYKKWKKDLEQYNSDMEIYEQIKLIKLVKNASEKYCLKSLRITKIKT